MLLEDASHDFTTARHGLVGRNGAGKTLLLRLLLGELPAQSGRIERRGRIAAVPQSLPAGPGVTLADVAGMTPALRALARIEAGTGSQADFDLMDGRWRVREEWPRMLADAGLPAWPPERPASAVSGGELTRVALAGALAQGADGLLLDEPTNHLDARARGWLMDRLTTWRGGLIVASHDRTLLDTMSDIVALERARWPATPATTAPIAGTMNNRPPRPMPRWPTPAQNAMPACGHCASATTPSSDAARAMRGRRATPIRRPSCWA